MFAGHVIAIGRYDLAFLLAGAIALSAPAILWRWPRHNATLRSHPVTPFRRFSEGIREVVGERRVLLASVAQAAQFLLNGSLNAFLPLYASEVLGVGAAGLGWLFALQTVTTLVTRPVFGAVSDRIGRRGFIVTGLTVCSAAVWLLSRANGVPLLVTCVVGYAAGVAVTTAATSAYITDVAPRARYGAAHGVFGTIYDVGDAAGPILAGLLVSSWGYAPMFQVMALIAVTSAVTFYVFSRSNSNLGTSL